jgi:ABC-2 type transport system ATP-binding protein
LSVEGLRKCYGDYVAVDGVTFEVRRQEILGILGPNGAGKTTTVECLQGLRIADEGRIEVLGLDPRRDAKLLRRRIGAQLQDSALPERIKVWEALDLFASLATEPVAWEPLLEEWGLADKREATFGSLSGGQQQRLFVALALVNNPELVFLDEMTTGLDPAARRTAWELIKRIRDRGATVVLVTHFMDEAEALCDRLIVINDKRTIAAGTPGELVDGYGGGQVVRFTTDAPELSWLQDVPHVEEVRHDKGRVEVRGAGPVLAHVGSALVARGLEPTDLRIERPTLEDVYLRLAHGKGGVA